MLYSCTLKPESKALCLDYSCFLLKFSKTHHWYLIDYRNLLICLLFTISQRFHSDFSLEIGEILFQCIHSYLGASTHCPLSYKLLCMSNWFFFNSNNLSRAWNKDKGNDICHDIIWFNVPCPERYGGKNIGVEVKRWILTSDLKNNNSMILLLLNSYWVIFPKNNSIYN